MAYAEAASVLGIPIGTLMSRLGRGRAALRAFEEGEAGDTGRQSPGERPRLRLVPPQRHRESNDDSDDAPELRRAARI
jgi:RNA polymerase sigma-70 factor (ECF subfamily)